MDILYESTVTSGFVEFFTIIVPVAAFLVAAIVIACELIDEECWTKWCTRWVIIFLVSIALTILVKDNAPIYRYLRVDASTITDWDEVIQKYKIEKINGKILDLTEKDPID